MAAEHAKNRQRRETQSLHEDTINYRNDLITRMNESRIEGSSCNIVLVVENQKFPCHRVVLNAATDFFDAMLNCDFQEKDKKEVPLDTLSAVLMGDILQFIYTGEIHLNEDIVEGILVAADYLLLSSLKGVAESFIANHTTMSRQSPLYYLQFSVKYHCEVLKERCLNYVLRRFMKEKENTYFLELEEDVVREIISSDKILVEKEIIIFDELVRWVNHKPKERVPRFTELFQHIRLCSLNPEDIRERVIKHELVQMCPGCTSGIASTLCSVIPNQVCLDNKSLTLRNCFTRSLHMLVGGKTGKRGKNESPSHNLIFWDGFTYLCPIDNKISVPHLHGSAQLGNSLFILGGKGTKKVLKTVKHVDLCTRATFRLPEMLHGRASPAVVFHDGLLYVIGGSNEHGEAMSDVECYDSSTNKWSSMPSLQEPRMKASAVSCSGGVFCIGGQSNTFRFSSVLYNSVERFNTETNKWDFVEPMSRARTSTSAVVVSGKIYVMGGSNTSQQPTNTCEVYNPSTNCWALIDQKMPSSRSGHAACVLNDQKIFLFGGIDSFENKLTYLDTYDVESKSWLRVDVKMPWGLTDFQSYIIRSPKTCALEKLHSNVQC